MTRVDDRILSRRALFGLPRPSVGSPRIVRVSAACLEARGTACRACETACDEDALVFRPVGGGKSLLSIAADRCTGCGACLPPCPARALTLSEETSA
ncbi:4Fe-4S dicluster domain-containing protein [Rhodoblastus acidophilus]|uniref:4Fe-4S dicluster domain-containing protein n=1 Tax=Rhodoblastus acidophilus TaxID=1074 RepID=UPI003CD001B6